MYPAKKISQSHFLQKMSLRSADLPTSAFLKTCLEQLRHKPLFYESRALPLSYRDKKER